MPKFGVGVITVGKRPIKDYLLPDDCEFVVVTDTDRRGPAWARNQCLQQLDHCEHIFLFDDDCWPVMRGWAEYWSSQCEAAGVRYSAMPEAFKSKAVRSSGGDFSYWDGGIGAATYRHQSALKVIGGYNEKLQGYGFEDAGMMHRALHGMMIGGQVWLASRNAAPIRLLAYIHSADVYGENPEPSYTVDEKEARIAANRDEYLRELDGPVFIPYK